METRTSAPEATTVVIPAAHREAATRYIAAIVRRDPLAMLGQSFIESRTGELLDAFAATYANVVSGPYARHGADAMRIALARL
jgi:hypothetical protein